MNNIHKPGRPRKILDDNICTVLLTMYETKSTRQIAEAFKVSQPTICKWLKKAREQTQEKQVNGI